MRGDKVNTNNAHIYFITSKERKSLPTHPPVTLPTQQQSFPSKFTRSIWTIYKTQLVRGGPVRANPPRNMAWQHQAKHVLPGMATGHAVSHTRGYSHAAWFGWWRPRFFGWLSPLPRYCRSWSACEQPIELQHKNYCHGQHWVIRVEVFLVSWCFKPSQPQRITSGLNTNFTPSPS